MSKNLSKYIADFDYFDNILIVLSATIGRVSIISFTTVIGTPVGILPANFSLSFSLTTGITKKTTVDNKKYKEKTIRLLRQLEAN